MGRVTFSALENYNHMSLIKNLLTGVFKIKIGDFLLINMDKPHKQKKIHDHVEKEDVLSFFQLVVDFL